MLKRRTIRSGWFSMTGQFAPVFLKEFADNGILLELAVWIRDPSEGQNNLRSDINWAIWRASKRLESKSFSAARGAFAHLRT